MYGKLMFGQKAKSQSSVRAAPWGRVVLSDCFPRALADLISAPEVTRLITP